MFAIVLQDMKGMTVSEHTSYGNLLPLRRCHWLIF